MKDLWQRFKAWWIKPRDPREAWNDHLVELHEQNKEREKEWYEACAKQERQELRDRFAMAALTGLLTDFDFEATIKVGQEFAEAAYVFADAMLKARDKSEGV